MTAADPTAGEAGMAPEAEARAIAELLERLRAADRGFRVFGSGSHGYRVGRPLAETEVSAFEETHGVRLPEDYRLFLTAIGDGGAGPSYGLETLEAAARLRDLARPFPHTEAVSPPIADRNTIEYDWDDDSFFDDDEDERRKEEEDDEEAPGVLELCHHGCGIFSYLVVTGPTRGTMWDGEGGRFHPTGLSFAAWYRAWAERVLGVLAYEPLVERLRVGMTRDEVRRAVPLEWKDDPIVGPPPRILFQAARFPAQLELDANGRVSEIRRWPHI